MATVSLSPAPLNLSAMSTRRAALTSNPNAANSPLRANLGATHGGKRLRSHADLQREEAYGQPPPAKRQMIEHGIQRPSLRSPSTQRTTRTVAQRQVARTAVVEKSSQPVYKPSEKEVENVRQWQAQTKSRFPKMVVYFESIPDEHRVKLAKQVTVLGGREEKFFSINITHVVTTRPIPSEKAVQDEHESNTDAHGHEQPKTIDPSLLNRTAESTTSVKRKLLFDTAASRRIPVQVHEDVVRKPKPRNADVLYRAREMGKKIWSLDKMQKILDMVLEPDPYKSALLGQGHRTGTLQTRETSKAADQPNILQLLQNERVHGPSDRDPTVTTTELNYFKGPYIYIYDIEEKMKPIMVREYPKVADKKSGEWPQFRVASQGRCPFVEDQPERPPIKVRERLTKATEARVPAVDPPQAAPSKSFSTEYRIQEQIKMAEEEANRQAEYERRTREEARAEKGRLEFDQENAFMSRAKAPRFVAGEPVASGVQPSKLTSAIRSQMISSTSGVLGGVKAGTSKEIHGLQRKVLQKNSTPAVSQDLSSRRLGEMSHDSNTFIRSTSVCRPSVRGKLDMIDEDDAGAPRQKLRRTESAPAPVQEKQKKRDLKPGYCENCADKFDDFDDHILTRKHRKFAENEKNWAQLDDLLSQLKRRPKYQLDDHQDYEEEL
ncbi:hypothetical protein CONLIGDRAFT_582794 [Coniochaeta ligniaria NRRL 30616]|uniref:DBF4-type domain-containing protein n=1 Tax=Coniochaeta ligniaria NRRL 30616 TaxID=1408157 RepID=A0A1J7IUS7_9PEZI|nr:hypothetical protein CONLIGDRAFT_582794 [Coniochaeta ligniaria NRRL 30616]